MDEDPRNDPAKIADLYAAYQRVLRRYAARKLGEDAADDIVAETFLRAWRRRFSYQNRGKPLAWLYVIAAHLVADEIRRRIQLPERELDDARFKPEPPRHELHNPRPSRGVREMIAALPFLGPITRRNIADQLTGDQTRSSGPSRAAARMSLRKAIMKLRRKEGR